MKITQDQNLSPIHSNVTVNQLWFAMTLIRDSPKINWFATTIFRDHYPHSFWYDNQTAKTSWWQEIFAMKRISQILSRDLANLANISRTLIKVGLQYVSWQNRIPLNHCMAKPTTESPFLMTIWTFLQLKSPTLPIFTKTPQYRWSTHWVNHANNLKVKNKEKSSNGQLKEGVVAYHFSLIPVYDSSKK